MGTSDVTGLSFYHNLRTGTCGRSGLFSRPRNDFIVCMCRDHAWPWQESQSTMLEMRVYTWPHTDTHIYIQVCTHIGLVHTWVIVSRVCKRVHGRYMWCAPKHISIAITGNFVNGGATDDQCPLTFIYRFYVRFTGHRVVQSAPRFWTRIRGHWCDHQIATQNQRVPDLVFITRDRWFMTVSFCRNKLTLRRVRQENDIDVCLKN